MNPMSSLYHSIPTESNSHHCGYGGATIPVHITSQQHYNSTGKRKSNVRLNDQLIPKPTDINIGEKVLKTATPQEHPYSSHISRFALFPSFCSPDDPQTGVRAASQLFLNPLIPNSAPDVTVLGKTIGGPYRHEILENPMKTRRAVMWPGEHGFLDHTKPLKQERQVFYPTPPKTVLPNPKLRDWDLSISERTSNMLKNLERALWVTSYQLHYTGSGPANPLKIDDFKERMSELAGINSAPLRERSYPVFVLSEPKQGCRRKGSCVGRSTCSLTAAEFLNSSPAATHQQESQEITAKHNEETDLNPNGHSQSENSAGSTEAQLSQEVLHKQGSYHKSYVHESRENCKVQFDESLIQASLSSQEGNSEQRLDLNNCPPSQRETNSIREKTFTGHSKEQYFEVGRNSSSHCRSAVDKDRAGFDSRTELLSRAASEQEKLAKSREMPCSSCNPCILPRPRVLPGIQPKHGPALSLTDLQNSFSKSEAHRTFNSSITPAAVNLRDNVVTGKKHDFSGINCYYLHG